ncbi:MAG: acyl-CoA carboxylase subunit beta [Tetrasphaera sp.]
MTIVETRPYAEAPDTEAAFLRAVEPDMTSRLIELRRLQQRAQDGPSERATQAQHDRGKLTVRERLELLFDPGTFREIEQLRRHQAVGFGLEDKRPPTDGVVIGWGMVHGRKVFTYAHDFRIFGGSLGEAHAAKIHKVLDLALAAGAPIVALSDGAGARIQEGVTALAGYGGIFRRNVEASGVIPQISVMLGPCAGGATYSPALTDFVFMVRDISQMYITGPDVVQTVTGESITHDELGGALVHTSRSGAGGFLYDSEEECLEDVRYLISLLPANNLEPSPVEECSDPIDRECPELADIVPAQANQAYDVKNVIESIVDDGDFFEFHQLWAPNIVCGLARVGGRVVGVVANQPMQLSGVLDIPSSEKGARFVQMCDAFNIPLLTLVDVPGFLPGGDQEHNGIIRRGAKLLYAYCAATVPRVQVILRKAYGGAYIVMDSRSIGCDVSFAWPTNEIAVMGAEAAVNVIFRKEISKHADPEGHREGRIAEYKGELMHPYYAAERGLVDEIIDPAHTRERVIDAFNMLESKRKFTAPRKHGNPPL